MDVNSNYASVTNMIQKCINIRASRSIAHIRDLWPVELNNKIHGLRGLLAKFNLLKKWKECLTLEINNNSS